MARISRHEVSGSYVELGKLSRLPRGTICVPRFDCHEVVPLALVGGKLADPNQRLRKRQPHGFCFTAVDPDMVEELQETDSAIQ